MMELCMALITAALFILAWAFVHACSALEK
jgi:hypothetical protein